MKAKQAKIVIGLGYGDEGKGLCTDFLCRQNQNSLVIRFSGGHQAGHTVINDAGDRHVFSSFGSGTLSGVPSYWSRFCTFFPVGFFNELLALKALGLSPKIYVDALAPVTSPYDVYFNHYTERANRHGSCGLGFGSTIQRSEETPYKLYVKDLQYPTVLEQKLQAIETYYSHKVGADFSDDSFQEKLGLFKQVVQDVLPLIEIVEEQSFFKKMDYETLIFEGSQGILLDMDHGFFPNVTRCNTTTKNAMEMIHKNKLVLPEIYYISRAYQTRHGNGFLSNEDMDLNVTPNPIETNQYNKWQGHQRLSPLDLDLLNYAFDTDKNYSAGLKKNLLITCLDQLDGNLQATKNGILNSYSDPEAILKKLTLEPQKLLVSYSDCAKGIETINRKKKPSLVHH